MKVNLQAPVSTLFNSTMQNANMLNTDFTTTVANTLSDVSGGSSSYAFNAYNGYYWPFWEPYNTYYHSCYHTVTTPDKFETAFKLSRKLMDKKLVTPQKTVEDFFKLMDAIVEVL